MKTLIGSVTPAGSITTVTFTVPVVMPAGVTALAIFANGNGRGISSVADSRGNTWVVDFNTGATAQRAGFARSILTTALEIGDTITATLSGTCSSRSLTIMTLDDIYALDRTVKLEGVGVGAAIAVTSAATQQAREFAVGVAIHVDTETFTQPAGWDEDLDATVNAVARTVASKALIAPGAVTYDPDGSSALSSGWTAGIVTYRQAARRLVGVPGAGRLVNGALAA